MPFAYHPSGTGALRQGELLENVWWHRPLWPATPIPENTPIQIEPVCHPLVVVVHQDCDLERDYDLRVAAEAVQREPEGDNGKLIPQVLCCDAFSENDIKMRASGVSFERVSKNQVPRFHCLPAVAAGNPGEGQAVYLDFCGVFSVFTAAVYEAIRQGSVRRRGVVPDVYLHDLTHRAFGFLSRVALPP